MKQKVFNIGMPRGGTTSFAGALGIMGLKCLHNPIGFRKGLERRDLRTMRGRWDAMSNVGEWEFPLLKEEHPTAIFVCTYRKDKDAWARSAEKMIRNRPKHFTVAKIYGILITPIMVKDGSPLLERLKLVHQYHRAAVTQWSIATNTNVLFHEVGDGWEALCNHLGQPVPDDPYPWLGKGPL